MFGRILGHVIRHHIESGTEGGGEQARDGGGQPERGCLGMMGGRKEHCSSFKHSKLPGPDSCKVRNSPGILKN